MPWLRNDASTAWRRASNSSTLSAARPSRQHLVVRARHARRLEHLVEERSSVVAPLLGEDGGLGRRRGHAGECRVMPRSVVGPKQRPRRRRSSAESSRWRRASSAPRRGRSNGTRGPVRGGRAPGAAGTSDAVGAESARAWCRCTLGVDRERARLEPAGHRTCAAPSGRPSAQRGGAERRAHVSRPIESPAGAGLFRSRPISRILSWAAIHLGPALLPGSSRLPGARRAASSPLSGVAPGGVYRAGASPRRWCALTAPFHPCRRPVRVAWAVFFLLHSPSGFPAWALPSTLPFGVRTFLATARAARLPGLRGAAYLRTAPP